MTCPACVEAETKPLTGSFNNNCLNCSARMLAYSPAAFEALRGETAVPLQEAIRKTWPNDYDTGRAMVWDWIKKLRKARR